MIKLFQSLKFALKLLEKVYQVFSKLESFFQKLDGYRVAREIGGENLPVTIRLKRMGRRGGPLYRVVVADTRNPRQSVHVEDIGYYDPMKDTAEININAEKGLKWLKNGSKPTETVRSLLSRTGILKRYHEDRYFNKETEQSNS